MAVFEPLWQVVVGASAVVGATAAVGIYRRVDKLVATVQKHDRTLYGADDVAGWDGLVSRVAEHEAELEGDREDEFEG